MATRRVLDTSIAESATRILRRRRRAEPVDSDGDIIPIRDGEDFVAALLRRAPAEYSHFRIGEYLHVSDILGKCARRIALVEKFKVPMPAPRVSESMGLTYAQGTAIHTYIKKRIADGHPDKLYGSWSCRCGILHTEPSIRKKVANKKCKICGGSPDIYHELELRDDDLKIVGSPDITLYLDEYRVYYPIEIKSITYEQWKELVRAKPDHVLQVLFYWYLFRKLGYPVPNQISILYASKGYLFKSPYKEFTIYPESEISRLDPYLDEARALRDARNGGDIPVRTFCSSMDTKDAKECPVCNICFAHG